MQPISSSASDRPSSSQTNIHGNNDTQQKNQVNQSQQPSLSTRNINRPSATPGTSRRLPVSAVLENYQRPLPIDQQNSTSQITFVNIDRSKCRTILAPMIDMALTQARVLPNLIICADETSGAIEILQWLETEWRNRADGAGQTFQQPKKPNLYETLFDCCIKNIAKYWSKDKIDRLSETNPHFTITTRVKTDDMGRKTHWVKYALGTEEREKSCSIYSSYRPDTLMLVGDALMKLQLQLIVLSVAVDTDHQSGRLKRICSEFMTAAVDHQLKIIHELKVADQSWSDHTKAVWRNHKETAETNIVAFTQIIKPQYLVGVVAQYQNDFAKSLTLVSAISLILNENNESAAAIELIDQALEFSYPSQDATNVALSSYTGDGSGHCLFNKGVALGRQGQWNEACKHYQEAFAKHPEDFEMLSNLMQAAVFSKQYALLSRIIEQLPDSPTKILLTLQNQIRLTEVSLKELTKCNNSNVNKVFHLTLSTTEFKAQYQKQLATGAMKPEEFEQDINRFRRQGADFDDLLYLCTIFQQEELAVKMLRTIGQDKIQNNPRLQYHKVVYLSRQGEDLVTEITGYQVEHLRDRAVLCCTAALSCSNLDNPLKNFKLAEKYIKQAVKLDPKSEYYNGMRLVIQARLAIDNDITLIEQNDEEEQLVAFLAADIEPGEEDLLASKLESKAQDPSASELKPKNDLPPEPKYKHSSADRTKRIEAYLQKRVAIIQAQLVQPEADILLQQWQVRGQYFSFGTGRANSQEVKPLYPNDPSKKIYGCIKQQTAESVSDKRMLSKFIASIEAGFRRKDLAGVKRIPGNNNIKWGRVEVKISSSGERLYTDKIYRNESGALLIIFDNFVKHDKATRDVTKMEIIGA